MFKKFGFKIILLLFLVLAVSGCVNKTQEEAKDSETGSDQEAMTGEENDGGFLGSLKDALKLGKSMKCTWKKDEANFGTAYISDKKYKSENTVDGKLGYIVYDGECSYIWEDGKMEGLTYCLKPEDKEEVEPAEERVEEINDDQQEIMDKMKTDYDYQYDFDEDMMLDEPNAQEQEIEEALQKLIEDSQNTNEL